MNQNLLVAIPTETVYGLAANAENEEAVLKVFESKERPKFNPLIVHGHSIEQLSNCVVNFGEDALKLAKKYWPGPLTLLLNKQNVSDLVTAGSKKVAIRIPNHELTLKLLKSLEYPLVAPSANKYQRLSPTSALHVEEQLGDNVSYILDGGTTSIGIESTIVGFEGEQPILYRYGGVSIEHIEKTLGKKVLLNTNSENSDSPGLQKVHYSPTKKLIIGDIQSLINENQNKKIGVLSFSKQYNQKEIVVNRILSSTGSINEAATNLFGALNSLEKLDIDVIITELVPSQGIGYAINDRLERAAAKY